MDKYFIVRDWVQKRYGRWRWDQYSYLNDEKPGVILTGPGTWRLIHSETVSIGGKTFYKIAHRNISRENKNLTGILRLNDDGTVEEIEMYAEALFARRDTAVGTSELYLYVDELHCDGDNVACTAIDIERVLLDRMGQKYPELRRVYPHQKYDVYKILYKYYTKHGGLSSSFIDDFVESFFKSLTKKYDDLCINRYVPNISRKMFMFDGSIDKFDIVRIMIPMVNPDRGKVSLIDIVKKYKETIFTQIYNQLEEYSGIPKAYFKMDNCTLTHDECLSFIFSIKEHPTEKSD